MLNHRSRFVAQRYAVGVNPDFSAIWTAAAVFPAKLATGFYGFIPSLQYPVRVVGVEGLYPCAVPGLVFGTAGDFAPAWINIDCIASRGRLEDADRRMSHQGAEARLAGLKLLLGAFALGNIYPKSDHAFDFSLLIQPGDN